MPLKQSADIETASICEALGLETGPDLISIVGGGGKSALLFALADALPGYTLLTTTTRIFASQISRAETSCRMGTPALANALRDRKSGLLVIGDVEGDKAMGVSANTPGALLGAEGVDFVVVEADGSRMRPAKAPADHEPVVPAETTLLVVVAGIDALDGPIAESCHRPERVAALLGVSSQDTLDPAGLAALLCHPEGGLKEAPNPEQARVALWINKVETAPQWVRARAVASACQGRQGIDRVIAGAIEPKTPSASGADFEVWLANAP
jgi:molybdenum cofactor cytidylyltransferase